MSYIFYIILVLFFLALFGEFLVFDEEFILITSVLLFLGASYNTIAGFLVSFLDDRSIVIKRNFKAYFAIKTLTLTTILDTYKRINNSNLELLNILNVVHGSLSELKETRNVEVEHFLNYFINSQLNVVLLEKLNFIKNIYFRKLNLFFSNLLVNWRIFELRNILNSDDLVYLSIIDDLEKSANLLNSKKLDLLSISMLSNDDLLNFRALGFLSNIFTYIDLRDDFLFSYVAYLYISSLKKIDGN